MQRPPRLRALALFGGLLAYAAPTVRAVEDPNELIGRWRGFYHSVEDPNQRGGALLDVSGVQGRRFSANLRAPVDVPIDGRLTGKNRLEAEGDNRAARFAFQGCVETFAQGSGRMASLYHSRTARTEDHGALALLKSFVWSGKTRPCPIWPGQLAGAFIADPGPTGPITGRFGAEDGPDFDGAIDWGDRRFAVVGTLSDAPAGDPADPHFPVRLLGQSSDGAFLFLTALVSFDPSESTYQIAGQFQIFMVEDPNLRLGGGFTFKSATPPPR